MTSETAGSSENDITFNEAMVMLFLDMIIFAALAWYAGNVRSVLAILLWSFSLFDNDIIPISGAKRPLIVGETVDCRRYQSLMRVATSPMAR